MHLPTVAQKHFKRELWTLCYASEWIVFVVHSQLQRCIFMGMRVDKVLFFCFQHVKMFSILTLGLRLGSVGPQLHSRLIYSKIACDNSGS